MKPSVLRVCLLWLMILIIPAQAVAGVMSAACADAPGATQPFETAGEPAHMQGHDHHAMLAQSGDSAGTVDHYGCVLCATSCHGISALTSGHLAPLDVVAPSHVKLSNYLLFVGHTPEPLKRPPRHTYL